MRHQTHRSRRQPPTPRRPAVEIMQPPPRPPRICQPGLDTRRHAQTKTRRGGPPRSNPVRWL